MPKYVLELSHEELMEMIDQKVNDRIEKIKDELVKLETNILGKDEAAKFLNVSHATLNNWMKNGKNGKTLPYERAGRSPYFKVEHLLEFKRV